MPGADLDHGARAAARTVSQRGHIAVDPDHFPVGIEPHQVEREPHPDGVHRPAAPDQQRAAGRRLGQERKPEQAGAEPARLKHDEPAADLVSRKSPEPAGQHIPLRAGAEKLAPAV